MTKLKSDHRTRLAEQEAVLEDERRRLEIESVRLREGLAEAQRIITELEAAHGLTDDATAAPVPAPAAPAPAAPEPAAPEPPAPEPAVPAPRPADSGPDLELQLDEEEPPAVSAPAPAQAAATEPAAPKSDVPVIEMPASDVPIIEMPDEAPRDLAATDVGSKARVIDPTQLADIRRKMQEKMQAAKRAS